MVSIGNDEDTIFAWFNNKLRMREVGTDLEEARAQGGIADSLPANRKVPIHFLHPLEMRKEVSKNRSEPLNFRVVRKILRYTPKPSSVRDQAKGMLFHLLEW